MNWLNSPKTGIWEIRPAVPLELCVLLGFVFKNQRLNRTPPNIEFAPLLKELYTICPARNVKCYLNLAAPQRGTLFLSSKTGVKLHPSSISKLLCEIIEEVDPGSFPQAHDVRRASTSIACTRGLDPAYIAKRVFWRSSNIFID